MKEAAQILHEILSERQGANPSYSLRAFARDLEVSPQQLSHVLKGERGMSARAAERVSNILGFDHRQTLELVESFRAKFSNSKTQRMIASAKLKEISVESGTRSLDLDLFKVISNWYHFALIELVKMTKVSSTAASYAKRLGVAENEIKLALSRLERLELISKSARGWKVNQTFVNFEGVQAEAVKSFHRQMLEKSLQALAFQNSNERYGSSSTMPVKVKNLAKARKLIQKFRIEFANEISDHEEGDEVFGLSLQFFKLTQSKVGEKQDEQV